MAGYPFIYNPGEGFKMRKYFINSIKLLSALTLLAALNLTTGCMAGGMGLGGLSGKGGQVGVDENVSEDGSGSLFDGPGFSSPTDIDVESIPSPIAKGTPDGPVGVPVTKPQLQTIDIERVVPTVNLPDAEGKPISIIFAGLVRAVPDPATTPYLYIVNRDTGETTIVHVNADGSFEPIQLFVSSVHEAIYFYTYDLNAVSPPLVFNVQTNGNFYWVQPPPVQVQAPISYRAANDCTDDNCVAANNAIVNVPDQDPVINDPLADLKNGLQDRVEDFSAQTDLQNMDLPATVPTIGSGPDITTVTLSPDVMTVMNQNIQEQLASNTINQTVQNTLVNVTQPVSDLIQQSSNIATQNVQNTIQQNTNVQQTVQNAVTQNTTVATATNSVTNSSGVTLQDLVSGSKSSPSSTITTSANTALANAIATNAATNTNTLSASFNTAAAKTVASTITTTTTASSTLSKAAVTQVVANTTSNQTALVTSNSVWMVNNTTGTATKLVSLTSGTTLGAITQTATGGFNLVLNKTAASGLQTTQKVNLAAPAVVTAIRK